MAKKRRRTYRPIIKADPVPDQRSEARRALDGFINTLAYLGEASDLSQASDYQRHSISRDYELLTVMYRENWIAKRIIDTPCEDMTRSWYTISSEIEQDKLDELAKLEIKHSIKQEITNGLRWARLYGGAAAVIVLKGQEDMLDQPLDYDTLTPGCFRGLIIVDRTNGLYPSIELEEDMDDPEFGYPMYYDVIPDTTSGEQIRIHHSRLIPFRGRMLPIQEEISEDYWGASELEHIYEELQKRNATSANIAQLVFQANVSAMKIGDFGEALAMGTDKQKQRIMESIYNMNRIKNNFGILLMGNEDNYEQHPYSFAGIAEVYESFMMDMAGAAEIPATKLYGRSPQGMNATGESDMKNYYEMLAQLQERHLRPAIEKLLPIMAMSLWGKIPEDMEVVFEPLMTSTPAERATIMQQSGGAVIQAYSAGLLTQKAALIELQKLGKDIGAWNFDDDLIEKADDEFEQGEEEQDPMGMMGPGGPGMPGGRPEAPGEQQPPPNGPQPPQKGQQQPPEMPEVKEQASQEKGPQAAKKPEEQQKDDVSELRDAVMRAVESKDFDSARAAVRAYRIKRDKARIENVRRKRSGFIGDMIRRVARIFNRDWEENQHPRGKAGRFVPKGTGSESGGENSPSEGVANSPQAEYNHKAGKSTAGWKKLNAAMEVGGPKAARDYCKQYFKAHPEAKKEIPKYMDVRKKVANFTTAFPNAENYNTYDAETGEVKDIKDGFCVTFHQNNTADDPLGGYSDEDYAAMCAIAVHELGASGVNIGYYGNPEVSFECKDEKTAKEFAVRHNQQSVYNAKTGRTLKNKLYRADLNPIRLD